MIAFLKVIFGGVTGLFGGGLGEQLRQAYEAKLSSETSANTLEAERDIARISAAMEMAKIAASDRWGATSLGRYLIVVPYGIWWALIFFVSIANGLTGTDLTILDVPADIRAMAKILVPAIILADGAALVSRRWK